MATQQKSAFNTSLANIHTPLLKNHWYVAARSNEIGRELLGRYILERNIVFYRKLNGTPVALQNRCAHRSFPLSESHLVEDSIVCGYHGIRYNAEGVAVDVPCQKNCPKNIRVRHYPVKEFGPLIWIWMGDPELADESLIPDVAYLDSPDWTYASGQYHVPGNYLLMHENLCDLSHFAFLHGSTFSFTRAHAELPVEVEKTENQIKFWRKGAISDAEIFFPPYFDISDKTKDTASGGTFICPALSQGWRETTLSDPIEGEPPILKTYVAHFLTPEHQGSCHYYWFFVRNYALKDASFGESFQGVITKGFAEDIFACTEMQKLIENDKTEFSEHHISGDKPGNMMRRIIKTWADGEAED